MRTITLLVLAVALGPVCAAQGQVHLGLREQDALAGYTVSWLNADLSGPTSLTFHGPDGDVDRQGTRVDGPTIGLVYEATLPAIPAGSTASYTLGATTYEVEVPGEGGPLRVIALGDMGTTREAGLAVDALAAFAPHLVIHAGDVSYAEGDPMIWEAWFEMVEPVASRAPWIPAIGNHEADVAGLSRQEASVINPAEQAFFEQRFPKPRDTFHFSYDLGGVHFIALDTFSEVTVPEPQLAWLQEDLRAAQDADWIVAYLHEPPYSSNDAHGSSPRAHAAFAAILEAGGVDLVITAHDHHYERTHVLRDGEVVATGNETRKGEGTRYVVTGGGGASLYTEFVEPQPEWSATREALFHVLALEITPERLAARVVPTVGSDHVDAFAITNSAAADDEAGGGSPTPASGIALALLAVALAALSVRVRRH